MRGGTKTSNWLAIAIESLLVFGVYSVIGGYDGALALTVAIYGVSGFTRYLHWRGQECSHVEA